MLKYSRPKTHIFLFFIFYFWYLFNYFVAWLIIFFVQHKMGKRWNDITTILEGVRFILRFLISIKLECEGWGIHIETKLFIFIKLECEGWGGIQLNKNTSLLTVTHAHEATTYAVYIYHILESTHYTIIFA